MDVLFVVALSTLALLALRFGADSRPTLVSDEEQLARWGVTWELGGWQVEDRCHAAAHERQLGQLRSTAPTTRLGLAPALRGLAARLDDRQAACDGRWCESQFSVVRRIDAG